MYWRYLTTLLIVSSVASVPSSGAQESASQNRLTVEHFLDWERVSDPQISPDGSRIVYTRSMVDQMKDKWEPELWTLGSDGTKHRFLTKGSTARWSKDGTRIAYIAEGEPQRKQIFVRWMDAEGATSQVTRVTQTPANLSWAPDGKSIAFTMIAAQKEKWDISMPDPPEGAEWTEPPRIVKKMHYRQDRRGFMKEGFNHLFVVPADGGTPRQFTDGSWHVGARTAGLDQGAALSWTPDGGSIVFDGLMAEDADLRYRESHVYSIDVKTGDIRQITKKRGPWGAPQVSPDGRKVAFAGYEWTPQTYRVSDLYVINMDGSGMKNLSADLDRDARPVAWDSDSRVVYFNVSDRGSRNVYTASMDGHVRQLTDGVHMMSLTSLSKKGIAVGTLTSPHKPGDVVRFDLEDPREIMQLTHGNEDVLVDIELGEVEEIWYDSTGGTRVQGWIVKPPSFDPNKRYPLILQIHGGPHGMYSVGFNYSFQNFAANDFVVLYTNPRGSTGYGTDFGNAIDNGYPSVDHDDLMAGVDALLKRGYLDSDRLHVTGCSGGGVLSSWAIGQTDRFAAAAVRCPVVNWMSFAGTTDITIWGYYRFEGYPWDNAEKWLKHSPLMYVGNVKTPTLLMTGELDLRTPMGQTDEYYQALKVLGVPTAMLRFNKEYHGTGSIPSNFMRTQLYIMDWFHRYQKGMGEATEPE